MLAVLSLAARVAVRLAILRTPRSTGATVRPRP